MRPTSWHSPPLRSARSVSRGFRGARRRRRPLLLEASGRGSQALSRDWTHGLPRHRPRTRLASGSTGVRTGRGHHKGKLPRRLRRALLLRAPPLPPRGPFCSRRVDLGPRQPLRRPQSRRLPSRRLPGRSSSLRSSRGGVQLRPLPSPAPYPQPHPHQPQHPQPHPRVHPRVACRPTRVPRRSARRHTRPRSNPPRSAERRPQQQQCLRLRLRPQPRLRLCMCRELRRKLLLRRLRRRPCRMSSG